jgi:hypothetical protein
MMRASFVPRAGDGASTAAAGLSPDREAAVGSAAGRVVSDAVAGAAGGVCCAEASRAAAAPS